MIKTAKIKRIKGVSPSVLYEEWLMEQLKDHELAVAYLNNALKESKKRDKDSLELLLVAFRNVIKARGGLVSRSLKIKA
jgi:DNA-binding phage protein